MAGSTIGTHLDENTIASLKAIAGIENRPISQLVSVALKAMLDLSPGARRALFAIDGSSSDEERAFAMKTIGRSVLTAYDSILDTRHQEQHRQITNAALDSDDAIEAEAVHLCRM